MRAWYLAEVGGLWIGTSLILALAAPWWLRWGWGSVPAIQAVGGALLVLSVGIGVWALWRMAGLEAARARGRKSGRKPVMNEKKLALASRLMEDRETPIGEVCEAVGVSRATLYRHLTPDR